MLHPDLLLMRVCAASTTKLESFSLSLRCPAQSREPTQHLVYRGRYSMLFSAVCWLRLPYIWLSPPEANWSKRNKRHTTCGWEPQSALRLDFYQAFSG